jgi:hypothetical protein
MTPFKCSAIQFASASPMIVLSTPLLLFQRTEASSTCTIDWNWDEIEAAICLGSHGERAVVDCFSDDQVAVEELKFECWFWVSRTCPYIWSNSLPKFSKDMESSYPHWSEGGWKLNAH